MMNSPLVVGYKGEIGSFILSGLLRIMPKASNIWCVDINDSDQEVIARVKMADVIFLCVPMQETMNWLLKYKIILKSNRTLVLEQCSLKEWLYNNDNLTGLNIRSMHVLFRPSQTPDLTDRKVALFESQFAPGTINWISREEIRGITQSELVWYKDAQEHDKEMALQQALVHRTLLVLGKMLKGCSGSTYMSKRVIELCDRIKKGDIDLYKLIQENKYTPDALQELRDNFVDFDIEKIWWDK